MKIIAKSLETERCGSVLNTDKQGEFHERE